MVRKPLKSKAPITPNSHFTQKRIKTKGKKKILSFLLSLFLSIVGTPLKTQGLCLGMDWTGGSGLVL
jgi:hypothetical protein